MTFEEILTNLEQRSNLHTKNNYLKNGAIEPVFGVNLSQIRIFKKSLKRNHELSQKLWSSKYLECKILAVLIADYKQISYVGSMELINDSNFYMLTDILVDKLIYKTTHAQRIMHEIIMDNNELIGRAGWKLLENFATKNTTLSDAYFLPYLECIRTNLSVAPNSIKQAMNGVLIALGCRNNNLKKICIDISTEIGKVFIHHGKTVRKSLDAKKSIELYHTKKKQTEILTNGSICQIKSYLVHLNI